MAARHVHLCSYQSLGNASRYMYRIHHNSLPVDMRSQSLRVYHCRGPHLSLRLCSMQVSSLTDNTRDGSDDMLYLVKNQPLFTRTSYMYIDGTCVGGNYKRTSFVVSFLCFDVKYFTYIETHDCRLWHHIQQQHQLTKKNKFKTHASVENFVMLQIQLMQRKTKIEELGQLSASFSGTWLMQS